MREALIAGDVIIDSKRYVIDKRTGWLEGQAVDLQDGSPQIPVSSEWPIGLPGGMGETQRVSRNSAGSAFATMDCSPVGFYRLPPRRITVAPTYPPADKPTWFREQAGAGVATFEIVDFQAPNATTGDQSIAHNLGVIPKAVIFFSGGKTADATASVDGGMWMGWADVSGTEAAAGFFTADGQADVTLGGGYFTDRCFVVTNGVTVGAPTILDSATAVEASWSTTNVVINWTVKSATQQRMHALIIAGTEVSAKVVNWTATTGTGTQAVTGAGFKPDLALTLSTTAAVVGASGTSLSFGGVEKDGNQFCIVTGDTAGAATSANALRAHSNAQIAASYLSGTFYHIVKHLSMNDDGFSVNKQTMPGASVLHSTLCIKGLKARIGYVTKSVAAATAAQAAVTLPFTNTAYLVASAFTTTPADQLTSVAHNGFGIGGASGTTAVAASAMFSEGSVTTTDSYGVDNNSAAMVQTNNTDGTTIDSVAACAAISMGTAGWLNWTTNAATAQQIFYIALAPLAIADADPYILAFNGQRATQMSVAANVITVVDQEDFGAAAQCGHPSKFLGEWYLPLGAFVAFSRLTVISSSGMTWVADVSGDFSLAFANIQDGFTSKMARAYSTNLVDITTDGATFDASGFNIGDTSSFITSMEDSGTQLAITKSDGNLYIMDATGSPLKASSSPVTFSDPDNGCGLVTIEGTNAAVWNTFSALMLYRGDDAKPQAVGPDTMATNRAIPSVTHEPHRGRHYEQWPVEDTPFIYSLYRVTESSTTKTYILCGEKTEGGIRWHPYFRYDGVARGLFCDSRKRLWCAFVTDGEFGYFQLGKDGSPDAGRDNIGYGKLSTSYDAVYPRDDFGFPHTLKQFRDIELKAWNNGTTTPVQLTALIDGGSANNVGATITTGIVNKRYWTLASNDTGYDLMVNLNVTTTAGYDNTDTTDEWQGHSLRVHAFLRPDGARKVNIRVNTEDQYSNDVFQADAGMDPKMIRDTLQSLERAAPVAVIDADGNSKNLYITEVTDVAAIVGDGTHYEINVQGVVWVSS